MTEAVDRTGSAERSLVALVLVALLGLALFPSPTRAHDIPNEIVLQGFVKPDGDRLHLIVRIPLIMLLNLNLPKKQGPGYLDLAHIDEALKRAVTATAGEIVLYEGETRLMHIRARTRISRPSERNFETFGQARAHIAGPPLPEDTNVFWNQGFFDAHLEYPIGSERSDFSLDMRVAPGLSGRLKMIVRFLPPNGPVRAYQIHGGFGLLVLDPRWHQAAWTFTKFGFSHIFDGIDHLLFLLCLVIPFSLRHFWSLVAVVTSFTVAHSITLIASASGAVPPGDWFAPLVETLIALSIFYMALENIIMALRNNIAERLLRRRWLITGVFGLVHGFGFSFALQQDLQFVGSHFLLSLLSFNVGIEIAQTVALILVLPALGLLFRHTSARRVGTMIMSAVLAHTAWHWMVDRAESLRRVGWLELEADSMVMLAKWASVLVLLGGGAWLITRGIKARLAVQGRERRMNSQEGEDHKQD